MLKSRRAPASSGSAPEKFPEQPLRVGKPAVVDLRRPKAIDIEIGRIGDPACVGHKPVVHVLDEKWIVAEIADSPFGKTHAFAVPGGKLLVPLQAKRRLQIELVPSLAGGTLVFEIVDVEPDVVDDVVAGIGEIGGTVLRSPSRAPVIFEAAGVPPEYLHLAPERRDVVGLLALGEPGHGN